MQGHYVQTWCHKYSTCPLQTIKPWLQEVVPSVHCLQRVFLCAKPKAACEPHCLSLAATSSSLSLCATMTLSIKTEIRKILLRRHKRTEPRPWVTCIKKFGKDRARSSKDMAVNRQTHTQRHDHYNTLLPYRKRSKQKSTARRSGMPSSSTVSGCTHGCKYIQMDEEHPIAGRSYGMGGSIKCSLSEAAKWILIYHCL